MSARDKRDKESPDTDRQAAGNWQGCRSLGRQRDGAIALGHHEGPAFVDGAHGARFCTSRNKAPATNHPAASVGARRLVCEFPPEARMRSRLCVAAPSRRLGCRIFCGKPVSTFPENASEVKPEDQSESLDGLDLGPDRPWFPRTLIKFTRALGLAVPQPRACNACSELEGVGEQALSARSIMR